jgi:hypothetical protein
LTKTARPKKERGHSKEQRKKKEKTKTKDKEKRRENREEKGRQQSTKREAITFEGFGTDSKLFFFPPFLN